MLAIRSHFLTLPQYKVFFENFKARAKWGGGSLSPEG
jgi:hypothetical protein